MAEQFEIIYHHNKRWQKCNECNFESQITDITLKDIPTRGMKMHQKNGCRKTIESRISRLERDRDDLWHFVNEQSSLVDELRKKVDDIDNWVNEQKMKKDAWD